MSGTNLDVFLKSRRKVHQQIFFNGLVLSTILLVLAVIITLLMHRPLTEMWLSIVAIITVSSWLGVNHYANKLMEAEKIIFKLNKEFQLSNKVKGSDKFTSSDKLLLTSLSK